MTSVPPELSALVRQRAHWRCEVCGVLGGGAMTLDPHHRQARGMGGVFGAAADLSNDIRNMLAVCRRCHNDIDNTPIEAQSRGWLVPHPIDPYVIPVQAFTVNGFGWWLLTDDAGYQWVDPEEAQASLLLYGLA